MTIAIAIGFIELEVKDRLDDTYNDQTVYKVEESKQNLVHNEGEQAEQ